MANFNRSILCGNLTRDPETKQVGSTTLCKFGIAVNRTIKGISQVLYIEIECWDKVADLAGQYLKKGRCVLVEGRIDQQDWIDKTTGAKRSKHIIAASSVQFMDSGDKGEVNEPVHENVNAESYDSGLPF